MAKLLSQTEKYHLLNDSDDSLGVDVDFQRARPRAMQFARWLLAASIGTLFTISIILNIVLLGRQTKDAQVGTKWGDYNSAIWHWILANIGLLQQS